MLVAGAGTLGVSPWLVAITVAITLISLCVLAVAGLTVVFVIRWRNVGQFAGVPNVIPGDREYLRQQQDSPQWWFDGLIRSLALEQQKHTNHQHETVTSKLDDVLESLGIFHQELTKKDTDIKRLKEGGDAIVFKRYLGRFLRVLRKMEDQAEDMERNGQDATMLKQFAELLEDALFECGLKRYRPDIDSKYQDAPGVADRPKEIPTDDPAKHLHIAEILCEGFVMHTAAGPEYVQKAEVSMFVHQARED